MGDWAFWCALAGAILGTIGTVLNVIVYVELRREEKIAKRP
jgi:hypothetical protein